MEPTQQRTNKGDRNEFFRDPRDPSYFLNCQPLNRLAQQLVTSSMEVERSYTFFNTGWGLSKDDPIQGTRHWMANRAHPFPLNPESRVPDVTATTYFLDGERPSQGGHRGHSWSQKDERNLSSLSCLRLRLADCVDSTNSNFGKKKGHVNRQGKKNWRAKHVSSGIKTNSSLREVYSLQYWVICEEVPWGKTQHTGVGPTLGVHKHVFCHVKSRDPGEGKSRGVRGGSRTRTRTGLEN